MGSILENMHRARIANARDFIHNEGDPNVNTDHKLESIFRCRLCGYIYDESVEGKPFTLLDMCPQCGAVLLTFEQLK